MNRKRVFGCLGAATLPIVIAMLVATSPGHALDLPDRDGPRPQTTNGVPHVQIGIEPVPELTAALLKSVSEIPDVDVRATVISLPGAMGFWLNDAIPLARPDAIVGGREFAHVHPDGSLHASLEPGLAKVATEAGWAIFHPWADQRDGWDGFVMIYTPTTEEELDVVVQLVIESYNFVTGRNFSSAPN